MNWIHVFIVMVYFVQKCYDDHVTKSFKMIQQPNRNLYRIVSTLMKQVRYNNEYKINLIKDSNNDNQDQLIIKIMYRIMEKQIIRYLKINENENASASPLNQINR